MSHPSSAQQPYEPLPLTTDDNIGHALYNARQNVSDPVPPSPSYHAPQLPEDEYTAPQPRFLGQALYSEGGTGARHSFASHQSLSSDSGSQYTSSVYALNDGPNAPPLSQLGSYRDDPNALPEDRGDMPMSPLGRHRFLEEKRAVYAPPSSRRKTVIWAIVGGIILLVIIIVLAVYFGVIRPKSDTSVKTDSSGTSPGSGSGSGSSPSSPNKSAALAVTGGNGSVVTMDDGTTFIYNNSFGGTWYWDENDPFNNGARAQSWTPALNETFNYGVDRIRGSVFLIHLCLLMCS